MLCCRRISATGTPASPCFRMLTIWLSVKRDFRMGISFAPERLPSNCLPDGEAYGYITRVRQYKSFKVQYLLGVTHYKGPHLVIKTIQIEFLFGSNPIGHLTDPRLKWLPQARALPRHRDALNPACEDLSVPNRDYQCREDGRIVQR